MTYILIATMMALLAFGAIVLHEDKRRRLVDRQLNVALATNEVHLTAPVSVRRQEQSSRGTRLARLLLHYDANASTKAKALFIGIGVAVAVATIGFILVMQYPLWGALGGCIDGLLIVRFLFGWQRRRYCSRIMRQLPDTLQMVISAVRAGLPVSEAFRTVAREMPEPTREQFTFVNAEMAVGRPTEEALRNVYHRTQVAEYAIFSVTLAVQAKAGGRLAETLQTLADTVRERIALAGRARALAAEAKLSARVLAAVPFVAALGLYVERPESLDPLFHDPRGRMLFAIGIVSLIMGIITMSQMIRRGTAI